MKQQSILAIEIIGLVLLAAGFSYYLQDFRNTEEDFVFEPDRKLTELMDEDYVDPLEEPTELQTTQSHPMVRAASPEESLLALDRDKAYPGFTVYPESGSAKVFLINMSGEAVHSWNFDAARARLLPNCNLLVVHGTKWGLEVEPWRSLRAHLREYDWDGNVVWEYVKPGPIHHDVQTLENGNLLSLHRIEVPDSFKHKIVHPQRRKARIRSDEIFEVTRDGKEVWNWYAHEHLDLNWCGPKGCPSVGRKVKQQKKTIDWTHSNTATPIPENKWFDGGDERFRPGNVLFMPRNLWTAMIIDKKSGEIVWRYRGDYKGGLIYGHETHMIPKGLPGAGNVLIFDNGHGRRESYALEIDPTTQEVVWVYDAGRRFFSNVAGSLQRLPNGNTLISSDVKGRVFEVTPDKQIVWEYVGNRIRSARAHRYEPNHCPRLEDLSLYSQG